MGCLKKIVSSPIFQPIADVAAIATGNPELIPVINAGATKLSGGSWGDAAKSGALSFAGQEVLPALGNAFGSIAPETAASLGITGGANTLTDLLGQTTGGGSLAGAGTIGGDIAGIASGGTSGTSTMLSRLLSGSGASGLSGDTGATGFTPSSPLSISAPSTSGVGTGSGLTGDFAKGLAGNSSALSTLASPSLNAGFGGGASSFGTGGGSSFGGLSGANTLGTLLGGFTSLNANDKAQKALLNAQQSALAQIQPFQQSGVAANSKLSDLLGTSSNTSAAGYGTLGQPFTPGDLTQDPGYQFQLQQGTQALDRKAAASGNYFSGAALKGAQDYGQGLAGTTYNDAYQRYLQQQQQQYGMLAGQSGQGASAAGTAAGINENTGNAKAAAGISSSNILNQTLSSLLSGSGAKRPVNIGGQVVYV